MPKGRTPDYEKRYGKIKLAAYIEETENGPKINCQLSRLYVDKETGKWRRSTVIDHRDLPVASQLQADCHRELNDIYLERKLEHEQRVAQEPNQKPEVSVE